MSGRNHPTMQRLLTETGPLDFQIEQVKKQIADRGERLKNLKEETREIEQNRKNECGEKPATGQKRHRDEEEAGEEEDEEMCTGCPSCRWEAWLEKEYEKKEMMKFSDADDVVALVAVNTAEWGQGEHGFATDKHGERSTNPA